jgi:hypothetical protein
MKAQLELRGKFNGKSANYLEKWFNSSLEPKSSINDDESQPMKLSMPLDSCEGQNDEPLQSHLRFKLDA